MFYDTERLMYTYIQIQISFLIYHKQIIISDDLKDWHLFNFETFVSSFSMKECVIKHVMSF